MEDKNELLKQIPKVDVLLSERRISELSGISRAVIIDSIRDALEITRRGVLSHKIDRIVYEDIITEILNKIELNSKMHLRRVVNGTGTVLHTNLGRAVLAKRAALEVLNIASCYSNLEFDLDNGIRGSRYAHVEDLICQITGAEAALVVNNNAAAIMLALDSLCKGREAIVSRGQLVEIGGSFRIPEVMALSGAFLVEVGTTNRTHPFDYEKAINENTGVILKVHQSNYKILGFTEEVELSTLVEIGNKNNIPVIEDIGSGVFIDISKYGLNYEPMVQNSIISGVDIVTFSGDKLLGGPQAGIIAGKRNYIDLIKKNQLTRALRIDKLTLAALEATLRIYLDEEKALEEIPSINMITKDIEIIKKSAQKLLKSINFRFKDKLEGEIVKDFSQVGGGAMPLERLDTYTVALKPISITTQELEYGLRRSFIPIITRVYKDRVIIDVRTLFSEDYKIILDALTKLL